MARLESKRIEEFEAIMPAWGAAVSATAAGTATASMATATILTGGV